MESKPKIIFYGAFDRYNYGDNLMPILLEKYFLNEFPNILNDFDFEFSSVLESNLSRYGCKKTLPIRNLLKVTAGSLLIVVGGETMGATRHGLYLHTFDDKKYHKLAIYCSKLLKIPFIFFSYLKYPSPWYYPYIPNKKTFSNNVRIILNTVGGVPATRAMPTVKSIDYISVRDRRSFDGMKKNFDLKLVPDSVLLLSKLYSVNDLRLKCRDDILKKFNFNQKYIVIQMCPYKASCDPNELSNVLMSIKKQGVEPVLLPIGYASGHDDIDYLSKVQMISNSELELFYELTVWEIAYFIANSSGFYGTSLHGVITAMSYAVPHFCINQNLAKLTSFLETWSIDPFSKPILPEDISKTFTLSYDVDILKDKIHYAQDLIEDHYQVILNSYIKGGIK